MRSVFKRLAPALALPLVFAACDESGFGPSGEDGTMSIMLTDAPGDFEHAWVTIESIELLGDDDRIVLRDEPVTVDLLTLQNEVLTLVGETPVPGGRYSELRLVITDGLIEVEQEDGSTLVYASSDEFAESLDFVSDGDLQMPSFGQSGLKIKLPNAEAFVDGDENAVLIDFSVSESFGHQAGNSGRWVMHPVIHATGFSTTGALSLNLVLPDSVTLPTIGETAVTLGLLSALLDRDGDPIPVAFTDADENGTWEATFRFLPPGDYSIDFGLPDGLLITTDPVLPLDLTVSSGQTTTQTITITSAGIVE